MRSRGTSVVAAALVIGTTAHIVHIGNGYTYRYCQGESLKRLTRDHSVVANRCKGGVIRRDDVHTQGLHNQIFRCPDSPPVVEIERFLVALKPDDLLLLCSHDLWTTVRDPAITSVIASSQNPAQISKNLVQIARRRGSSHDMSVIVVGLCETTDHQKQHRMTVTTPQAE